MRENREPTRSDHLVVAEFQQGFIKRRDEA